MYYLVRAILDFALYGRSGSAFALGFGTLALSDPQFIPCHQLERAFPHAV